MGYAKKYLVKVSSDMTSELELKTIKKTEEILDSFKENVRIHNKITLVSLDKIIDPLDKYLKDFINNLFIKLGDVVNSTSEILYSTNLKNDLENYNNYINRLIDKDIILDKEFMVVRKKLFGNNRIKKDNDNIREIDGYLDDAKDGIISNIKITIMDLLKTNSFNINKTITCSNFIKYSTKDKIEELNEEDLMKMFDLLIKNE